MSDKHLILHQLKKVRDCLALDREILSINTGSFCFQNRKSVFVSLLRKNYRKVVMEEKARFNSFVKYMEENLNL